MVWDPSPVTRVHPGDRVGCPGGGIPGVSLASAGMVGPGPGPVTMGQDITGWWSV